MRGEELIASVIERLQLCLISMLIELVRFEGRKAQDALR